MVKGLVLAPSTIMLPLTMFIFILAMYNPIVKLKCVGPNCRTRRLSVHDPNYPTWNHVNQNSSSGRLMTLQSDGNLTLLRFSHGYVTCHSEDCGDCEGTPHCQGYDHNEFAKLEDDIITLNNNDTDKSEPWILPGFLKPECRCLEFCKECVEPDLVPLPGPGHVHALWAFLKCEEVEAEYGVTNGAICDLYNNFFKVVAAGVISLSLLFLIFCLMISLEFVNFHLFYDGKCKCCFISPIKKKILFTFLLAFPLFIMIWLLMRLYNDTEPKLTAYFEVVGATFEYDWHTTGYIMWWVCIGNISLSIIAVWVAPTTLRHLRLVKNYNRAMVFAKDPVDKLDDDDSDMGIERSASSYRSRSNHNSLHPKHSRKNSRGKHHYD